MAANDEALSFINVLDYQEDDEHPSLCYEDDDDSIIEEAQHYTSGLDAHEESGDVVDGCNSTEVEDKADKTQNETLSVGNSTFYPDQQESPSDENRGQLNVLSAAYESLDYEICVNSAWLDEERTKGYTFVVKKDVARWLVVLLTAVLTALIACVIDITIESLSKFKYTWLKQYTDYGVEKNVLIIPFLLWAALNIGPTLIAAFLGSCVEPAAAGSGIPQVKCYLNGVKVPRVVRVKTLLSKVVGVTMSVLGGLAVGKEGPMIHSGAVIAAGVSQGKTTSFKRDFGVFEYFREDHEKRDFVSAGAAAGVAAAFGAPVGGVLFSLEEGASFWNQGLTWRVFFGAMMSTFTLNLVLSTYNGVPGKLAYNGLLNFGKFDDLTYEIWEFIPFLLMGVMGGLLGALFNHINLKLTAFRMRYINKPWQKILEAAVVAFVTAGVAFLMIYLIHDCRLIDPDTATYPIQMSCGVGEENAVASIWFQTPEKSVRSLFHDPPESYEWSTIGVFFACYFFLACWTYGLGIPSGLFIPTLLCGAAWGRLVGKLMSLFFPNQQWANEGKYALVGAGAMLGGVVRMTLSLTVILMECVGNITFGLPLMIILMVAKWVGDFFNEGLYDIHIQMQGVPIMAWDAPPLSNNIYATEVMNRPVATLRSVESVKRIVNILKQNNFNGFPVVDDVPTEEDTRYFKSFGTLRGLILRSQLIVLLKHKVFNENAEVWQNSQVDIRLFRLSYPRYFTLDEVNLDPEDMNCTVDIRPFYNPSPYSVVTCTALPRMFNLFRALGLRHLVVVDDNNGVVGMVTRKDLVKYRIWKHRGQMGLEELVIYNNVS
ncbi:H(+)/Cl(-) exchange transporter 7 isoform X2 [Procambarus clarkii]|uniref:H(+)/Cl(-) exchange transporter 7 isoform X2 n=1 Tax=Procambarus clarkii TaxID=6728 RepID=UPI001E6764F6|nr:H(+)/Cl(-) exchange transporter 7-like isoform X2 [Procambarus clarkii]XP_045599781.1 H(+)/Cl(-) exchange transporter 7-like isoform X2 [Procambarus clarkii]XP_045599782.1 H(+)/Cl(-) exchange transporter 7-like isoform X2 [Procambarus clarkii]XP_045599783.1 H(+)/Cl(-) exchange transporter 7-like isoform X2 [Procambarus clarkii]